VFHVSCICLAPSDLLSISGHVCPFRIHRVCLSTAEVYCRLLIVKSSSSAVVTRVCVFVVCFVCVCVCVCLLCVVCVCCVLCVCVFVVCFVCVVCVCVYSCYCYIGTALPSFWFCFFSNVGRVHVIVYGQLFS
jgi:hypothetical protein